MLPLFRKSHPELLQKLSVAPESAVLDRASLVLFEEFNGFVDSHSDTSLLFGLPGSAYYYSMVES